MAITTKKLSKKFKRRVLSKQILVAAVIGAALLATVIGSVIIKYSQDNRPKASSNLIDLTINPASSTAAVNTPFTASIIANTNNLNLAAIDLHLSYNPAHLEISDFTLTDTLPVVLSAPVHANGTIKTSLGANLQGPYKGSGIIATFSVKRLTNTASVVSIADTTQAAAIEMTTNAIGNRTGLTLSPTPTPTPTPTLRPTPTPTPRPTSTPVPTLKPTIKPTVKPTLKPTSIPKSPDYPANLETLSLDTDPKTVEATWLQSILDRFKLFIDRLLNPSTAR